MRIHLVKTSRKRGSKWQTQLHRTKGRDLLSFSISCLIKSSQKVEKGQEWKSTGPSISVLNFRFLATYLVGVKCHVGETSRDKRSNLWPRSPNRGEDSLDSKHWEWGMVLFSPSPTPWVSACKCTSHDCMYSMVLTTSYRWQRFLCSKNVILHLKKKKKRQFFFPTQTLSLRCAHLFPEMVGRLFRTCSFFLSNTVSNTETEQAERAPSLLAWHTPPKGKLSLVKGKRTGRGKGDIICP